MDYTSLVITFAIALYVAVEYRRREKRHAWVIEHLKKGAKMPLKARFVERWRIVNTGAVGVLLLGATIYLIYLGFKSHPNYASPLFILGGIAFLLMIAVLMMFMRDVRARTLAAGGKED